MADEAQTPPNDDELLLTEEVEPGEAPTAEQEETSDEEEEVFAFGDEITDEKPDDSGLVKHLRTRLKEVQAELAERARPAKDQPIEVGEKPTLAGCEYDEERYEAEMDAYKERQAAAEKQARSRTEASEDERKAWETELASVNEERAALGRADAEDAFATVREALTPAQQALIVQTADKGNRAKLIYALAKNPAQLAMLAAVNVTDASSVAKFAKAVTQLEGKLKMVKRRTAPAPDTPQKGSAPISNSAGGHAKQLAKLHAAAQESGNYDEYFAYKRKHGG